MKNKHLAPPLRVLLKTTPQVNCSFRGFFTFTILLFLAIIPYKEVKGQVNLSVSQNPSTLCTGVVDFSFSTGTAVTIADLQNQGYICTWYMDNVPVTYTGNSQFPANAQPSIFEVGADWTLHFAPNQEGGVANYSVKAEVLYGFNTTIFGPCTVATIQNLYVKKDFTYISDCVGILDMAPQYTSSTPPASNSFALYKYNPTIQVSTFVANVSYNSSYSYTINNKLAAGEHYFYFNVGNTNNCSARYGLIQVNVLTTLQISPSNANLEPGTILSMNASNLTTPAIYTTM